MKLLAIKPKNSNFAMLVFSLFSVYHNKMTHDYVNNQNK